jgi:hypothetical protein
MIRKQKMLMLTFYYDPAREHPAFFATGDEALTEERLLSGVKACVAGGGLVQVKHVEVDLIRLARSRRANPPAHEWVGLTFLPVAAGGPETVGAQGGSDEP